MYEKNTQKDNLIRRFLCKTLFLPALIILSVGMLCSCSRKHEAVTKCGLYFDTIIQITIYDSDITVGNKSKLINECFTLCSHYENILSATVECSDIWNINHSSESVCVDDDTLTLIQEAIRYAEMSDGLVDPTIQSVSSLWNFASETPQVPTKEAISTAVSHVDYHTIQIQESDTPNQSTVLLKDPDASIGLGFIAKGYIADRLSEYLTSHGVKSALLNLGGNLLAIGHKPDGTDYMLGVQNPFSNIGEAITAVSCHDSSLVTSGNYERYFYVGDTLYHHILDTSTGYPVDNDLSSVTILSQSSVQGDALSTLCYILGSEAGLELIESIDNVEALFILKDKTITRSSGFPCE